MNTLSKKLIFSAFLLFTFLSFTTPAQAFNPITFLIDLYNDIITPDVVIVPTPPVTIIKTVEAPEPKVITVLGGEGVRGASGSMGPQGIQGPQGIPGPKGEKGNSGSSSSSSFFLTETSYNNQLNGIFNSIENGLSNLSESIGESVTTSALTVNGNATVTGTITGNLIGNVTGNVTGTIDPGFTTGSLLFQGLSGLDEDNTNLFWDDTNNRLGVGTATPTEALSVSGDIKFGGEGAFGSDGYIGCFGCTGIANMYFATNLKNVSGTPTLVDPSYSSWGMYVGHFGEGFNVFHMSAGGTFATRTVPFSVDGNDNVGVGTQSPSTKFHVIGEEDGSVFMVDSYNSAGGWGAGIVARAARGTALAPENIQLDDAFLTLDGRGYGTGGFGGSPRAAIYFKAAENWSSVRGSYISFETNLIGSSLTRTEKMRITDNGKIGIGDTSPDYLLELYDISATPAFALSDDDVAHGVTTLVDTDVFAHLSSISTTVGGAQLTGLADATGTALILRGIQSSDPTDTTPSVSIVAAKASGTGIVDLGAAETVFRVVNNDDTSAITVLGSASVGILDTTPDALLDVRGTVCLDLNADDVCTDNTSALSDSRLKTNVSTITNNLDLVKQLRPVRFTWNGLNNTGHADSLGFIAQEVEDIFPELIITDTAGYKNLDYSKLVAVVAGGVQELDLKVKSLDERLVALETNNGGIMNSISNGVSDFMDLVVRTLKIGSPEKRTGITFYDEVTGEPYCLSIADGVQKVSEGECGIFEDSAPVVSSGGGEEIIEEPVVEEVVDGEPAEEDIELVTEEVPDAPVVGEEAPEEIVEEVPVEEPVTP